MNKFLLILGLTTIYYIVIFNWDKRRKAAFKKAQQQVIGHTATIPVISDNIPTPSLDTDAVFGTNSISIKSTVGRKNTVNPTPDFEDLDASNSATSLLDQTIAADSQEVLLENLEEMVIDLQAEQTLDTPKENLFGALADTEEIMDDKALTKVIQSISKKNI